jgi:glucose-1-phosphate cytidylyltransferase
MKVIILAGGFGSRLGRRTDIVPKPMIKIGQKPILWHIMKIYAHYGFKDFVICLGYKGDLIKEYFLNFEALNNNFTINLKDNEIRFHDHNGSEDWNITLVDTGLSTLKGGRIKRIEPFLDEGPHFLTYGDGVADININKLLKFHRKHNKMVTITGVRPPARFGELAEKDNIVQSFKEKPQASQGLINGGFMVFKNEMLKYLTTDEKCDFEVGALEELCKQEKVVVYKHLGKWECMDNERDLDHLNMLWETNQAFWKIWD